MDARRPAKRVRALVLGCWLGTAFSLTACATYSDRTQLAREALRVADYEASLTQFNKLLEVRDRTELPAEWKHNVPLVVLERATVLQAMGDYDWSARDFQAADKELELLDIARDGAGKVGQYIYSDSATKYKTSPTEKLSLNAMNLCNYLVRGQLDGAKIEAKRFTVMRTYFRDHDPEHEHGAFGSYLAGVVYERLGNADEALRYYEEALQERDFATLRTVVPRLATRGSYRGPRITAYLARATAADLAPGTGEVLVVAKVGLVPYKVPMRIPIGAAIGLAGTYITGDPRILEHSMFKVVSYPELQEAHTLFSSAQVAVDGDEIPVDFASDLAAEIAAEYEELRPKILGAAITRMIVRAAAAEGARAAGRQAEGVGGLVGFLAAAAVEGTLVALDKPDTRSWSTLPGRVFIGRQRVAAGRHQVEVALTGPGGQERRVYDVDVPADGFVVLDVTSLR